MSTIGVNMVTIYMAICLKKPGIVGYLTKFMFDKRTRSDADLMVWLKGPGDFFQHRLRKFFVVCI